MGAGRGPAAVDDQSHFLEGGVGGLASDFLPRVGREGESGGPASLGPLAPAAAACLRETTPRARGRLVEIEVNLMGANTLRGAVKELVD